MPGSKRKSQMPAKEDATKKEKTETQEASLDCSTKSDSQEATAGSSPEPQTTPNTDEQASNSGTQDTHLVNISTDEEEIDFTDFSDEEDETKEGYTLLSDTKSKKILVKVDPEASGDRYVTVLKHPFLYGTKKALFMSKSLALKLVAQRGFILSKVEELKQKYKAHWQKRWAFTFMIAAFPFRFKINLSKINCFWYVDVRRFRGLVDTTYDPDNGICFPVSDFAKAMDYLSENLVEHHN